MLQIEQEILVIRQDIAGRQHKGAISIFDKI